LQQKQYDAANQILLHFFESKPYAELDHEVLFLYSKVLYCLNSIEEALKFIDRAIEAISNELNQRHEEIVPELSLQLKLDSEKLKAVEANYKKMRKRFLS
jgi:tetratricopeptide (TPR) repeat protein